jgi:hypothetical protein
VIAPSRQTPLVYAVFAHERGAKDDDRALAETLGKGDAPVRAVLVAFARKPEEPIAAPKGRGPRPPNAFSPANLPFLGGH